MPDTVTKKPIGPDDIQMDVAGSETVTQFTRTKSDGTTENVDSLSAGHIPVLDAPITLPLTAGGGRQPFARIATATDRDIEECLRDMRINVRDMKNFEHYGGTPGSGASSTVRKRNVEVWNKIFADIASESKAVGIFFPGTVYEFEEESGLGGLYSSHLLPVSGVDGLVLAGAGNDGTQLVHKGTTSLNLMHFEDLNGLALFDLKLDASAAVGGSAAALHLAATTQDLSKFLMDNCSIDAGLWGLRGDTSGGFNFRKLWITRNTFETEGIFFDSFFDGKIIDNLFTGTDNGGVLLSSSASNKLISGVRVIGNSWSGSSGVEWRLRILRSGTPNNHADLIVADNRVDKGRIGIEGFTSYAVERNYLFDGYLVLTFDALQPSAFDVFVLRNIIKDLTQNAAFGAIDLTVTETDLTNFHLIGNISRTARNMGINVNVIGNATSATAKRGKIMENNVLDPSQVGDGTNASIELNADANGGTQETMIAHNTCRSTVNPPRQSHGVLEGATGNNDYNRIWANLIRGYSTLDVTKNGANTQECTYAAGDFDLGAAV